MSISIKCLNCQSNYSVGTKRCRTCGANLLTLRKYKVRIKLPSGKWKTKTVESLELARSIEAKYKDDILRQGELGMVRAPRIEDVWRSFHSQCKRTLKHPGYYEKRWRCHVEPYFVGMRLDTITPKEVNAFIVHLGKKRVPVTRKAPEAGNKQLATSTLVSCVKVVGRLFSHARAVFLYSGENPVRKVKLPDFDNAVDNPLSDAELGRFLEVLRSWPNRMVALALELCLITGKRTGEVFSLTWEDVDLERSLLRFAVKSQRQNERQYLPMSARARQVLQEAARHRLVRGPLVFHTSKGKRIHYRAIWLRIKKASKLREEVRPHDLRHTFATRLASSGEVDIYTIQKLLGHKTIAMTQRYAHLMDKSLEAGLRVAEKMLISDK